MGVVPRERSFYHGNERNGTNGTVINIVVNPIFVNVNIPAYITL